MADLHHQIPIKTSSEKIYAALTTKRGLQSWWTADSKIDNKLGGKAEFGFDKRGTVFRMTIDELRPNETLIWRCHGDHPEWRGTKLRWNISAQDGMTMLRNKNEQIRPPDFRLRPGKTGSLEKLGNHKWLRAMHEESPGKPNPA